MSSANVSVYMITTLLNYVKTACIDNIKVTSMRAEGYTVEILLCACVCMHVCCVLLFEFKDYQFFNIQTRFKAFFVKNCIVQCCNTFIMATIYILDDMAKLHCIACLKGQGLYIVPPILYERDMYSCQYQT